MILSAKQTLPCTKVNTWGCVATVVYLWCTIMTRGHCFLHAVHVIKQPVTCLSVDLWLWPARRYKGGSACLVQSVNRAVCKVSIATNSRGTVTQCVCAEPPVAHTCISLRRLHQDHHSCAALCGSLQLKAAGGQGGVGTACTDLMSCIAPWPLLTPACCHCYTPKTPPACAA